SGPSSSVSNTAYARPPITRFTRKSAERTTGHSSRRSRARRKRPKRQSQSRRTRQPRRGPKAKKSVYVADALDARTSLRGPDLGARRGHERAAAPGVRALGGGRRRRLVALCAEPLGGAGARRSVGLALSCRSARTRRPYREDGRFVGGA